MQEKYTFKQHVEARVRYALTALGLLGIGLLSACGAYDQSDQSIAYDDIRPVSAPTPTNLGYQENLSNLGFPTDIPETLEDIPAASTPKPEAVPGAPTK